METRIIDKVAWIEIQDQQILSTRSRGKDKWYIPGGKREGTETDAQTLIREIKEELEVDLIPESVRYLGTFSAQADGHPDGVQVRMLCYQANYEGQLKASAEIAEWDWLSTKDQERIAAVDQIIFAWLKERQFIH
ncbi:MAG: NUDIX domain-containing protein [Bacteroidota bacterium]